MEAYNMAHNIIRESIEFANKKDALKSYISHIYESYNIDDIFFGLSPKTRCATELTEGYFEETATYNNLDEAIRNMDLHQCVRIIDNKEYKVGNFYINKPTHIVSNLTDISNFNIIK